MHTGKGFIQEISLDERRAARIACPPTLVPAPGQYLMAATSTNPDAALATPLFSAGACQAGFYAAPPLPAHWLPGTELKLRGPLGHGFSLPVSARKITLVAADGNCARILALLEPALAQKAAVLLLSDQPPNGLPTALEILPLSALPESIPWADYLAISLQRERLPEILSLLIYDLKGGYAHQKSIAPRAGCAQLLVETPMPCGGLAECGACAVELRTSTGFQLACKDGPVFDLY